MTIPYRIGKSIYLLVLLALCSCATTQEAKPVEPVQQEDIDESLYFDPYANGVDLEGYEPPKMVDHINFLRSLDYPDEARRSGVQGSIILQLYVDERGTVRYAAIEQSLLTSMDLEAQRNILSQRFSPGTMDGKPIKTTLKFPIDYNLNTNGN